MSLPYIKIIDRKENTKVDYRGDIEELVKMIVRICDNDEDMKKIILASAMTIYYCDGMDDIADEIRNL